ncbi:signal peptide peptidase SppA [Patescibacteria group bacterium]|nr:signal peptide peptidase SppA [Patescibacteria group bacterium]
MPLSAYKKHRIFKNTTHAVCILLVFFAVSFIAIRIFCFIEGISQCNVLVIKAHGDIVVSGEGVSADKILEYIEAADKNERIKAIILDIDSFGGSPVAGKEIADALRNSPKLTVAVVRGAGDSAAYMVASGAKRIFASAFSEVGNIGITMSYLDYSFNNESVGIYFQEISSGEFKDIANPDKTLTDKERELLLSFVYKLNDEFVSLVSKNRNMDRRKVEELADGSIMTAGQALNKGLIDEIGSIQDAKEWVREQIKEETEICVLD